MGWHYVFINTEFTYPAFHFWINNRRKKMAKAFSVLSWNVEHFGAQDGNKSQPRKPTEPIIDLIASHNADVIAIYEVVGSVVFSKMVEKMPGYQFNITEGTQSQEILIGVKHNFTSFFTQRLEFKSGVSLLRPGALLTLVVDGIYFPLLFLHLKSLNDPRGFGLRDDQTERALKFRKALQGMVQGSGMTNYIFLGDLNTMGMNLTYSNKDINEIEEIERLKKRAERRDFIVLEKTFNKTYWPGSGSNLAPSNLDQVVAANHLQFKLFDGKPVKVMGWPDMRTDQEKDDWAKKYSDHAMLYFEVQKTMEG